MDGLPTSNKGETGDIRRNMEHRGKNETADKGYARGGRTNDTAARKDQKEMETMRLVEEKRELKKRRVISEDDKRTYRTMRYEKQQERIKPNGWRTNAGA